MRVLTLMCSIRPPDRRHLAAPCILSPPPIVERDDGWFQIGWQDDAPGPFETRSFADAIRLRATRHSYIWVWQ
jgi:hypothetical protein